MTTSNPISPKIIQGFIQLDAYVSNVPGEISPIGELSTYSRTYSKEKGEYTQPDYPGYQLITFSALDQNSGNQVQVPTALVNEILKVSLSVVRYATNHARPYDFDHFYETIKAENQLEITGLEMGELVDGPTISLPQFLSWKSLHNDASEVRIWFSDEAFADQYTGYEITVIPPLENLNLFFEPYSQVLGYLDETSVTNLGDRIQEAKLRHPETVVRLLEFYFVNRHDKTVRRKTSWGILIYGKEGDYEDAIKDAIVDYVLENSNYNQEQWEVIFPELFERTEMVIVPSWHKVAVQNLTDMSSLYQSALKVKDTMDFTKSFLEFYPEAHIDNQTYILSYPWKTLGMTLTNGIRNTPGKKDFLEVYWDYLPIPSTSTDFARMRLVTQNLILFLDDVFMWAEKVKPTSPLPTGMRRVTRENRLFVSSSHNGISWLVAAKFNEDYHG